MSRRTLARFAALPLTLLTATLGGWALAGSAAAHVTIAPSGTAAGSYTVLAVSVPHGCEADPTTRVTIAIPEEIPTVTATRHPLWEVEKVMETLDQPITDAHGNEITERVAQVVYTTDQPLASDERDVFELSVRLPEDGAGTTLAFPTVQDCVGGSEAAWTEIAAAGQDPHALDFPAPTVSITEAGGGHGSTDDSTEESAEQTSAEGAADSEATDDLAPAAATSSDGGQGLALAGLVTGVLGILVGGYALVVARRRA